MYADDAAIFINPLKEDLEATMAILHEFGKNPGLAHKLAEELSAPDQMPKYRPRPSPCLLHWAKRILPVPLSRATTTYKILAEGPCTTPHRAHRPEATKLERQDAKQSG